MEGQNVLLSPSGKLVNIIPSSKNSGMKSLLDVTVAYDTLYNCPEFVLKRQEKDTSDQTDLRGKK